MVAPQAQSGFRILRRAGQRQLVAKAARPKCNFTTDIPHPVGYVCRPYNLKKLPALLVTNHRRVGFLYLLLRMV